MKSTGAIVYFLDDETAQGAIAETHQTMYGGRLLWVAIYELDPSKRNHDQGCVNLSISVNTGTCTRIFLYPLQTHLRGM